MPRPTFATEIPEELRRDAAEAFERTMRWLYGEQNSQFTGIDLSSEAVGTARGETSRDRLGSFEFFTRIMADLDSTAEPVN